MDAAKVLHSLIIAGVTLFPVGVAAQAPAWSGGTTAPAATNYDRYGQPITSGAATISQRTQNGISQTGTAMRDGVEAGIQQANDQLSRGASQAWDSTRNAVTGQPSTTAPTYGSTPNGTTSPWPTTPGAASNAPGWPSNATAGRGAAATSNGVTPVDGGWTSIGTSIPSPPLLVPQSPMSTPMTTTNFGGNSNTTATRNSATYPAVATNEPTPLHSVLADPSRNTTSANKPGEDWPNGWNNNGSSQPVSIGRGNSPTSLGSTVRDSDLVTVPNNVGTTPQESRGPMIGRPNEGLSNTNPWNQSEQNSGTGSNGAGNSKTTFAGFGSPPTNQPNNQMGSGQFAGQSNNAMGNGQMQNGQMQNGQNGANFGNQEQNSNWGQYGSNRNANGTAQGGRNQTGPNGTESQPWTLWILGVLGLAGSLAANLYLGASYLDARQKYQSLVRKTAETFRRVKSVAA